MSLLSTNINIEKGYNTHEVSSCNNHTLKNNYNLFYSQSYLSHVSSSSKIKHVSLTSVNPKSTISNVVCVNTFLIERLIILYSLWNIYVVIKDCFNEFNQHNRKVQPDNNYISRNDLGKLLFSHFLNKHEFLSEEDVHTNLTFYRSTL